MFSGKTTEAMRLVGRARLAGARCAVVKYSGDTRYGEAPALQTHGGLALAEAEGLAVHTVSALTSLPSFGAETSLVVVDEGQFFPDLSQAVDQWLREGRSVVVAALDGDFLRRPFASVAQTLPLANVIVKLSAVCQRCPRGPGLQPADAPHSLRTDASQALELIGASDKYQAVCLECFLAAAA